MKNITQILQGRLKWIAVITAIVMCGSVLSVSAADQTARLKENLKNDIMYSPATIDNLQIRWTGSQESFIGRYDGKHVVVTGEVRSNSVNTKSKEVTLYGSTGNTKLTVDMSGQSDVALSGLKAGNQLTVYGQISVTKLLNKSYKLEAEHATTEYVSQLASDEVLFYPDEIVGGVTIDDIATDRHVSFRVPEEWMGTYVCSGLTNNGINGYQFSLNALAPQNTEYPEIFYIFYFDDETYLEKPPQDPTDGDNKDIEEVIIRNILENLEDDFKIKLTDITSANGKKYDYCSTTYRPADGNDYRLEFVFVPEKSGITCMLYLYYPRASAVNHLREVTAVVESVN